MDAQRSVVPVAMIGAVLALAFAWHQGYVFGSSTDPVSEARLATNAQCAQRVTTPYAQFCVPDGWTLEAQKPGVRGAGADTPATTASDYEHPAGAFMHVAAPNGHLARLTVRIAHPVPDDIATELDDAAPSAMRQLAINRLVTREALPGGGFVLESGGEFLPPGTVPLAEVYASSLNAGVDRADARTPEWVVFRGAQRIVIDATPGWIDDGSELGTSVELDDAAVTKAVNRVLSTWAWDPRWSEAPSYDDLVEEYG